MRLPFRLVPTPCLVKASERRLRGQLECFPVRVSVPQDWPKMARCWLVPPRVPLGASPPSRCTERRSVARRGTPTHQHAAVSAWGLGHEDIAIVLERTGERRTARCTVINQIVGALAYRTLCDPHQRPFGSLAAGER